MLLYPTLSYSPEVTTFIILTYAFWHLQLYL